MKKVLENELLSLAHRILQMKSKDVNSLLNDSKELYEKLLILNFYQERFELGLIKDISSEQIEAALSEPVDAVAAERLQIPTILAEVDYPIVVDTQKVNQDLIVEQASKIPTPLEEDINVTAEVEYSTPHIEDAIEPTISFGDEELIKLLDEHELAIKAVQNGEEVKAEEQKTEEPIIDNFFVFEEKIAQEEEVLVDELAEKLDDIAHSIKEESELVEKTVHSVQSMINDDPFLGFNFEEIEFVRVDEVALDPVLEKEVVFEKTTTENVASFEKTNNQATLFNEQKTTAVTETVEQKAKSINDIYNAKIVVGLNDRIAFERYLFEGSSEDFNRVLSQLNTVNTFDEAKSFVEHLVKPEYNNWEGKEDYEERLMQIIEKRFI